MAPVENRLTISETGSTSSMEIGCALAGLEAEQAAQRHQALGLLVHAVRVLLEDVVAAGAGGVLEAEDRLRVEQVRLALAAPLVLAADLQARGGPAAMPVAGYALAWRAATSLAMTSMPTPPILVAVPLKYFATKLVVEADGLEDLGAAVGGDGGDAHLGHDLQDALAERLDQVADGLLGLDVRRGTCRRGRGPRRTPSPGTG